jgi:hypothetical protein
MFFSKNDLNKKYNMVSINLKKLNPEVLEYADNKFNKNLSNDIHHMDLENIRYQCRMKLSDKLVDILVVINSSDANKIDAGLYRNMCFNDLLYVLSYEYNIKFEENEKAIWTDELSNDDLIFLVEYSQYQYEKLSKASKEEIEAIQKEEERDRQILETLKWEAEQEEEQQRKLAYAKNKSYYQCQALFADTVRNVR